MVFVPIKSISALSKLNRCVSIALTTLAMTLPYSASAAEIPTTQQPYLSGTSETVQSSDSFSLPLYIAGVSENFKSIVYHPRDDGASGNPSLSLIPIRLRTTAIGTRFARANVKPDTQNSDAPGATEESDEWLANALVISHAIFLSESRILSTAASLTFSESGLLASAISAYQGQLRLFFTPESAASR